MKYTASELIFLGILPMWQRRSFEAYWTTMCQMQLPDLNTVAIVYGYPSTTLEIVGLNPAVQRQKQETTQLY